MEIDRLIWDPGNIAHIARHEVTLREVEEVRNGRFVTRRSYANRIMITGPTDSNRVLSVVLEPVGDNTYYVVTARPASRRERRRRIEELQ